MTTLAQDAPLADTKITSQDAMAFGARILLAAIFILSGFAKIDAADGTIGYIASVGLPYAEVIYYAVIALELVGGFGLVIGFKARFVALALAGFSIIAALLFHAELGDQNQFIHFLKNFALAGGLIQVAAFGPGKLSLDRG